MMSKKVFEHVKVNNEFNNVYADGTKTIYNLNDVVFFTVCRIKNDINGNPIYKIVIENNEGININNNYKSKAYRTYKSGYSLIKTYNLSSTLKYLFS